MFRLRNKKIIFLLCALNHWPGEKDKTYTRREFTDTNMVYFHQQVALYHAVTCFNGTWAIYAECTCVFRLPFVGYGIKMYLKYSSIEVYCCMLMFTAMAKFYIQTNNMEQDPEGVV